MSRSPIASSTFAMAVFAGLVVVGVAVRVAFESPASVLPALVPTGVGLFGVASLVSDRSTARLRAATRRAWLIAIVAVLPYGLATAPSNERAAAAGDLFSGPIVGTASEAVAGAALLCAVAITAVYGVARYGLHPGRPSPEERVLDDEWSD